MALSATKNPEDHPDLKTLHEGVVMTRKGLIRVLEGFGIKEFDPMGKPFDANFHTALFMAPIPGKESGTVFQVDKSGYMIKDRVLRSASVGVVTESS